MRLCNLYKHVANIRWARQNIKRILWNITNRSACCFHLFYRYISMNSFFSLFVHIESGAFFLSIFVLSQLNVRLKNLINSIGLSFEYYYSMKEMKLTGLFQFKQQQQIYPMLERESLRNIINFTFFWIKLRPKIASKNKMSGRHIKVMRKWNFKIWLIMKSNVQLNQIRVHFMCVCVYVALSNLAALENVIKKIIRISFEAEAIHKTLPINSIVKMFAHYLQRLMKSNGYFFSLLCHFGRSLSGFFFRLKFANNFYPVFILYSSFMLRDFCCNSFVSTPINQKPLKGKKSGPSQNGDVKCSLKQTEETKPANFNRGHQV